jgi:DNA-directed RNA polymerase subunit RPC12/RpoP
MSNSVYYFVQECPTCGRSLQIRVEYLGRRLVCEHCRGRFIARDPASAPVDAADDLLRRADALLESLDMGAARRLPYPR